MTTRTDGTGSYAQTYDAENRLISVNKSGVGTTTFGYDANGQRTTTLAPDGTLTNTPFPGYEQSYPTARQDTFPVNAANWNLENGGNWTWSSQFYVSNDTSNNALTTLKSATLGSSGVIAASIRANSNENGYLVFDYQNVDNYKYIGLNAQTDRWVFGQRVGSTNTDLYVLNQTVNNNQWYDVKVILSGNTAKLYVNGTYKAQYSYSATFTGGKVGLRTVNAITYFDNFLVSAAEISRSTYAIAGQVIATRISGDPVSSNNGLFYIFSDHLGSTSVLATTAGSQVPGSRATYYPFGSPRTTPTQTITDRNFTGQKENMELGLIYYNARYYVPGSGRFLTPDTIIPDPAQPQSFNRYSYVFNSPLKFTDPTGHDPAWCADEYESAGDPACNPTQTPQPPALPTTANNCFDIWCIVSPPSGLTSDGLVAWNGLQTIQQMTNGWWGDTLDAQEAIMLILNEELGNEIGPNAHHAPLDVLINQYNEYCSGGIWSARCINQFWGYSQIIREYSPSLDGGGHFGDPEHLQWLIQTSEAFMNHSIHSIDPSLMHYGNAFNNSTATLLLEDYQNGITTYASYVSVSGYEVDGKVGSVFVVQTYWQWLKTGTLQNWVYPAQ